MSVALDGLFDAVCLGGECSWAIAFKIACSFDSFVRSHSFMWREGGLVAVQRWLSKLCCIEYGQCTCGVADWMERMHVSAQWANAPFTINCCLLVLLPVTHHIPYCHLSS